MTLTLNDATAAAAAAHPYTHHAHTHHPGFWVLGTLLGFFLLAGLFRALRRRHGGRFGRPRRAMRWLFRRLDTSPAQERVIREAFGEVRASRTELRDAGRAVLETLSSSFATEGFDAATARAALSTGTPGLEATRSRIEEALAKVHAVLTDEQRKQVADILARGPGRFAWR